MYFHHAPLNFLGCRQCPLIEVWSNDQCGQYDHNYHDRRLSHSQLQFFSRDQSNPTVLTFSPAKMYNKIIFWSCQSTFKKEITRLAFKIVNGQFHIRSYIAALVHWSKMSEPESIEGVIGGATESIECWRKRPKCRS